MTAPPKLRVLEEEDVVDQPTASFWWLPFAAAALLGSLLFVIPAGLPLSQGQEVAPIGEETPPSLSRAAATEATLAAATAIAEELVVAVNSADSEQVIRLLSPRLPDAGLGSSEWPTLHGDVGWWDDVAAGARLDEERVTDFVRYFRTMPGGVVTKGCASSAIEGGDEAVQVDCVYSAFGGIRGLMGDRANTESGRLSVTVQDGLVVDVTQVSVINALAWNQLGMWLAATDPESFDELFQDDGDWTFRPEYNGSTAMRHAEAAAAFAAAIGADSLPFG